MAAKYELAQVRAKLMDIMKRAKRAHAHRRIVLAGKIGGRR